MNRTYRILIVVVLCAAAVGGYWKFVLAPKREEAAALQEKVAVTQAQLEQTQATLASYKKSATTYRENYATVVRLGKAVPADDDTRSLLVQLDTAAKRSAVSFSNIDLQQSGCRRHAPARLRQPAPGTTVVPGAIAGGSFSTMPFSFSFAGDFDSLSNFFARVEPLRHRQGRQDPGQRPPAADRPDQDPPGERRMARAPGRVGASTYLLPQTGATGAGPAGRDRRRHDHVDLVGHDDDATVHHDRHGDLVLVGL